MIKNTHTSVTDYAEAYRQAKLVHNQAIENIKNNYKEGSELYKNAMKTATDTLNDAVLPMKDLYSSKVKEEFEAVRKAVREVVTAPPTEKVTAILPMIKEGKLNDTELQMLLGDDKLNYMDTKRIYDALGRQFRTVESIMEDIDRVEASMQEYFTTYKGESMDKISYNNAHMLNGSQIEVLDSVTSEFIAKYSNEEGKE